MSPEGKRGRDLGDREKWAKMTYGLVLLSALALLSASCGSDYGGISRASAVEAAKTYVVREDYRRDEPLFYRNTGNRPAALRRTRDASGQRAWFVRFDDFQAMHKHCVMVRCTFEQVLTRWTPC
jgi:hypothetical protein